ncbi:MAG: hypothetical protein VR67_17685 [Peptococcaceae bacterium BRH_c8a]|nr:MAG: hypothetical protein VR67_17685 [Peptococcaceae bacterium BRH_c8a]
MDAGVARIRKMAKLCPFRKRRIIVAENEWEEHFMECHQKECAMWVENGCGLGQNNTITDMSTSQEATAAEEIEQNGDGSDGEIKPNDKLLETSIKVLEVKETNTPGTVRAWCQYTDNGKKEAFFAKNGAGQVLLELIGKQVTTKYRRMDNGSAFAVFVKAEE